MKRNRSCIFGRSTNSGKMSQAQRKTNAYKTFVNPGTCRNLHQAPSDPTNLASGKLKAKMQKLKKNI